MTNCLYCKKDIKENYIKNKAGDFCLEEHYEKYLETLSNDEYIKLQHSFCVCSDE